MAVNKVVYGNTTLIDLTGDTATPADVASGKLFHDKAGVQQTGSGTIVTPTIITPSNSIPVDLEANGIYKAMRAGKAVESIIKMTPSQNPQIRIQKDKIVLFNEPGYVIDSFQNISPSTGGTYFSSGMVKMSSSGYAYSSRPPQQLSLICSEKQISRRSPGAYLVPITFETSISTGDWLFCKLRRLTSSVENVGAYVFSYSAGKHGLKIDSSSTTFNVTFSNTQITALQYSGDWVDLYISIYKINNIF